MKNSLFMKAYEYRRMVEMTDKQYEDQYDVLFPDVVPDPREEERHFMEIVEDSYTELNRIRMLAEYPEERYCPLDLFYQVEDTYKELWATEGEMPTLTWIYDHVIDWLMEKIWEYAEMHYGDDPRWFHDEEYRDDCIEEVEDMFSYNQGFEVFDSYVRNALNVLGFTYIDDDDFYLIKNEAQISLFPEMGDHW